MTLPVRLLEMSRDDIRERVDQWRRGIEHGDALQPHAFVGSPLFEINVNVVEDFEMVGDESNGGNEDVPMPFPMQIIKGGFDGGAKPGVRGASLALVCESPGLQIDVFPHRIDRSPHFTGIWIMVL